MRVGSVEEQMGELVVVGVCRIWGRVAGWWIVRTTLPSSQIKTLLFV